MVEGDQKAPFSTDTTQRCRGGRYSFSLDCLTLSLIRTFYCWVFSKEVSSTIFKVFGMMRPRIEPRSPGPLANTLPTGLMKERKIMEIKYGKKWVILKARKTVDLCLKRNILATVVRKVSLISNNRQTVKYKANVKKNYFNWDRATNLSFKNSWEKYTQLKWSLGKPQQIFLS